MSSSLFSRSMAYHRIVGRRELQRQRTSRVEDVPAQIILPSPGNPSNMTLPLGAVAEEDDTTTETEPVIVYSSKPVIYQGRHMRMLVLFVSVLIPLNIIMALVVTQTSPFSFKAADTPFDTLTLINTFASLFVLIVGVALIHPWLLLAFSTIYSFDAIVNLFRMHSSAQLGFVMCQWMLIYMSEQYRQLVKPGWVQLY